MKTLMIVFFSLIACSGALAQQLPPRRVPLGGQRVPVSDSVVNRRFVRLNITDHKLAELKNIGLDLRDELLHSRSPNVMVDAAMLPVVFIGRVLSIVNTPCSRSDPFHSEVNVLVIDLLKGPRQLGDTLQLLRQSGIAIIDGSPRKIFYSNDPQFTVGDTALFFLDEIDHDPYLTASYKKYFSNRKAIDAPPRYWVRAANKHSIFDSHVNYYGSNLPIDSITTRIRKVARILNSR